MTDRLYTQVAIEHFKQLDKMLLLEGPRQVGKTTIAQSLKAHFPDYYYLNWDVLEDREKLLSGATSLASELGIEKAQNNKSLIVFDEVHKFSNWKNFLKGFFDRYHQFAHILVTGSSKLGVYKRSGDSMMGRYFPYRVHPLTIGELNSPILRESLLAPVRSASDTLIKTLERFSGFPEPYSQGQTRFYNQWKRLWQEQLFTDDLRDISRSQETKQIQVFAQMLARQVGQQLNYSHYSKLLQVSVPTIKSWTEKLSELFYCYTLQPWSTNIPRALIKQPKVYCWNWQLADGVGNQRENLVASHLLKAVHFWTDHGLADCELYYIRDKDQKEVDFLVVKEEKPWFLVEVKSSHQAGISSALRDYQVLTKAEHAFQVVFDLEDIDSSCFNHHQPVIVPVQSFLSELV